MKDTVWYCGNCGKGPMSLLVDEFCAWCHRRRDVYATFASAETSYRGVAAAPPPPPSNNRSRPIKPNLRRQHSIQGKQDTSGPTVEDPIPSATAARPSLPNSQGSESQESVAGGRSKSGDQILEKGSIGREDTSRKRTTKHHNGDSMYNEIRASGQNLSSFPFVTEGPFARPIDVDHLKKEEIQGNPERNFQDQGLFASPVDVGHLEGEQNQGNPAKHIRDQGLGHYLVQLRFAVVAFLRFSPRLGCRRITWVCGCGKPMYADVEESHVDAADSLQAALRKAAASAGQTAGSGTNPGIPPQSSLSSSAIQLTTSGATSNPSAVYVPNPGALALPGSAMSLSQVTSTDIYLLLCINGRRLKELEQIKIMRDGDDQIMFQDIRQAYLKISRQQATDFHPDTPELIRKISIKLHNLTKSSQRGLVRLFQVLRLGWLVWWIGDNVFYIPTSANFVRFELVPIKTKLCPEVLSFPDLPPEEEVRNGNYHYVPCPQDVKNPLLRIPYLHVLFEPGNHLDQFWTNRTPKKLNTRIEYGTGIEPIIGWGIHLIEGPNWMAFSIVSEIVLILSLLLSVTYSICMRDTSSGFTMGAYMVAVLAVSNALGMVLLSQSN